MQLRKALDTLGLNELQRKVYLACLELGGASAYRIAQQANIARSTCYEIMEDLKALNLIQQYKKKKVKFYTVKSIQEAINFEKEKISQLEKALPEFNALYRSINTKPNVRLYEGLEGMKCIIDEIDTEADEILGFSSAEDMLYKFSGFWSQHLKKRISKKIPVRSILVDSPRARERQKLGPTELRTVKIIPAKYGHHSTMLIWKNKVAIFTFQNEMLALVIESKELAQGQRASFEFMWDVLK